MDNETWNLPMPWENDHYVQYSQADLALMRKMVELSRSLREPPEPLVRQKDDLGRQLFIVNEKYSYVWDGDEPILVGDRVKLPGEHGAWYGEVTDLGSPYEGYMRVITQKADPKR